MSTLILFSFKLILRTINDDLKNKSELNIYLYILQIEYTLNTDILIHSMWWNLIRNINNQLFSIHKNYFFFIFYSMAAKRTRLENYFNWRVRIILNDGRNLVGKLYATDKFLNVVLAETEEVRTVKGKKGADD